MRFARCGIILNTGRYAQAVAFYRDALGLEVLFAKDRADETLTAFDLGGVYLMVEPGGVAEDGTKPVARCRTKLRFDASDIEADCAALRTQGMAVDLRRHDWGVTAKFHDPDGNCCALRSEAGFG